jgi:hypothetical protein
VNGIKSDGQDVDSLPFTTIDFAKDGDDEQGPRGSINGVSFQVETKPRPYWQKLFRCRNETSESCEECIGNDNCFQISSSGMTLSVDGAGRFERFLNVVHVHCYSKKLELALTMSGVVDGNVGLLWDGAHVLGPGDDHVESATLGYTENATFPITATDFDLNVEFSLKDLKPGGHELALEFKIDGSNPSATISNFAFGVPNSYAECEDAKACLRELSDIGGYELRNSNARQLKCLSGQPEAADKRSCDSWLACLSAKGSDHDTRIRNLLKAAFSESSNWQTGNGTSLPADLGDAQCMNPVTEDPESWECDCYDEMVNRCEKVGHAADADDNLENVCIRAQFCLYPRVCASWKRRACMDTEVQGMMSRLEKDENASMLQTRQSQLQGQQHGQLDEVLHMKQCA